MKKLNHFLLLLTIPLSIGCGSKKDEPPTPLVTYALIVENEKPEYGDVTPIGQTIHNENENVTLTVNITQPEAALFVGFFDKDNDKLLSDKTTYTVTMNRDYHIALRWSLKQYQVIATSSSEKKGTVTGGGTFHLNDDVALTASPAHGYKFIGWYDENDAPVTTDNPYEFKMPSKDVKLTAKWDGPYFHLLKFVSEDKTIIKVQDAYSYAAGDKINVSASMLRDNNYLFAGWYKGDEKVSENTNFEYIMPDNDVTLTAKWKGNLDDISWQEIHDDKKSSIEVGSIKSVLINNKKHAVRVIAKNRDYLDYAHTGYAKYTFQFEHIITKKDGKPNNIAWDNKIGTNEDFTCSTLDDYLNSDRTGTLLELFPSDLRQAITYIYREVGVSEGGKFIISEYPSVKLFPLSVAECSANIPEGAMSNEGKLYNYYSKGASLIRCTVNGSPCAYWTRSPKIDTNSDAWCVDSNGKLNSAIVSTESGIAPCFCVGWTRISTN